MVNSHSPALNGQADVECRPVDILIVMTQIVVGLTGNIATGKSAVMALAAARGALTIDADHVVHEILAQDTAVQSAIVAAFGAEVQRLSGGIDRAALGQIVFADPQALRKLEQIVHPAVGQHVRQLLADSSASVVMIEAIKLLEGQLRALCHQIWVTTCSRQRQLERLQICRGLSATAATARIDAQNPQAEKIAQADIVIDTNGLMDDTRTQFETAWARLTRSDAAR